MGRRPLQIFGFARKRKHLSELEERGQGDGRQAAFEDIVSLDFYLFNSGRQLTGHPHGRLRRYQAGATACGASRPS
jgi:hypothetical protein